MIIMDEEWSEKTKQDYYLAQISAEIRQFREGFMRSPKSISVEDLIIKFSVGEEPPKSLSEPTDGLVEAGPELMKDPKWARVNENAKATWATRLQSSGFAGVTYTPPPSS